jgi:hypothetical protein
MQRKAAGPGTLTISVMKPAAYIMMLFGFLLGGCESPEATRARTGAGADMGNRSEIVRKHEGSNPYYKTPRISPAKHPRRFRPAGL